MKSKNKKLLASFTAYCISNPDQRFWQALRNWCGWNFLGVSQEHQGYYRDTFYWENNVEP